MSLVCGSSGLSAEALKELRGHVRRLGFRFKQGDGGWLYFSEYEGAKDSSWLELHRFLVKEGSLVPLYFKVGDRVISLKYGETCIKLSKEALLRTVCLRGLNAYIGFCLRQRIGLLGKWGVKKEGVK